VDAFVAEVAPHLAAELADHRSREWRRNSVADTLARGRAWRFESVPVREVLVVRAERALYELFARHGYRLREIVQDPGLLTEPAYGDHLAGEDVAYPILLALRRDGYSHVFDGVHRAVQLVRNGETTLDLCVGELP
jgi:hypothetical protein